MCLLADLYRVLLSVYQESELLPLPTMEEVLLCHSGTSAEDVSVFLVCLCVMHAGAFAITNEPCFLIIKIHLLWRRAMCDPEHKRIFCLVCEHNLSYKIAKEAVQSLRELCQGHRGRQWFVGVDYIFVTNLPLVIDRFQNFDCLLP